MASANDLNRLFNVVVDMLCIAGYDGYFKELSPAWERTLGYSEAELLAKPYLDFVHPDDRQETLAAVAKLSEGAKVIEFRNRYRAKDGTYRWLSWNTAPFSEDQLVYAVARDVTDLKRLEDRRAAAYGVTRVLATALTLEDASPEILRVVCAALDWDAGAIWQVDREAGIIRCVHSWHIPSMEIPKFTAITKESEFPPGVGLPGRVWKTNHPHWLPDVVEDSNFPRARIADQEGLHGAFGFPIRTANGIIGVIEFFSHEIRKPDRNILELFDAIGSQIGQFTERLKAEEDLLAARRQAKQIEEQKNRLSKEKLYLEEEIRTEYFGEIVGESPLLKNVLLDIQTVAKTSATVLILGETGTGKELIARALHNESDRKTKTFVKLNCSAIPTGLLESELFGHEKGAFTGAIAQKLGRLELADKGTLFLDEIGDIPLELQPKLLRALQEQEFERLGGTRTLKVDVRLIAATNRDLSQMVADRQFRSDLFYRLNVFPIRVPSLRERKEDIPRLVRHFASKYAHRMNKRIETIPAESMHALTCWNWPGNIRELENFIERAVILSSDPVLNVPISELQMPVSSAKDAAATTAATTVADESNLTLEEKERQHILKTLRETKWILSGPDGAAARLGLKRTTLQGKMKKLGIDRNSA